MAGTINTTNYNFKKYAPDDTVSMLQTFNGNMDAIDKAIKDRANVATEQGASITKLENGLNSTNNGLNSANQTISALQVQVTTNTRNIQTTNTEVDSLDARVQALEDGGSAIVKLNTFLACAPTLYSGNLYKQGNHFFGSFSAGIQNVNSSNLMVVSNFDNITGVSSALNIFKYMRVQGNLFGLNPNIGHYIGTGFRNFKSTDNVTYTEVTYIVAVYDGTDTYFGFRADTTETYLNVSMIIDTVI